MKVLLFIAFFVAVVACRVQFASDPLRGNFVYKQTADESQYILFRIALKQKNLGVLEDLFWKISTPGSKLYQDYRSKEFVDALVAPSKDDVQTVLNWLEASNIKVSIQGSDYLEVYGTVGDIQNALECELHEIENKRTKATSVKVYPPKYSLPSDVAKVVEFVQVITQIVDKKHSAHHESLQNLKPTSSEDVVIPYTSQKQYNAQYTITTKSSQCVAEFNENAYTNSDMQSFVSQVLGAGKQEPNKIDNIGAHGGSVGTEATLDIQWITAIGYNGTNYYYTLSSWILEFAQDLYSMQAPPLISSISWGSDERSEGLSFNNRFDNEAKKLGLRGIGICAASGDSGAPGTSCNGGTNVFNPSYPAASPYVLSVGATMFETAQSSGSLPPVCNGQGYTCATSGVEIPAFDGSFASGGGFSVFQPTPNYQENFVKEYISDSSIPKPPTQYFNSSHRGFPDVAANGLFNVIFDNGKVEIVGGTSASSPQVGGMIALLNDHMMKNGKKPIGFPNPLFYKAAKESPTTFLSTGNLQTNNNDGCQYGFTSNPGKTPNGWDPVNGLGTFNLGNIISYVDANMDMFANL